MNLHQLLEAHTWRMLRAISQTHGAPFDTHWSKARAAAAVYRLLSASHAAANAASSLPPDARAALRSLLLCGGPMPAQPFLDHFGPVRPFRPWREDSPPAPWRHPVSPAEHLWFLGLIYFVSSDEGDLVTIPDDLLPLLPVPESPSPPQQSEPPPHSTTDPLLTIVHLLAYLQGTDVHPIADRWLPLRHLRAVNQGLAHPDPAVVDARSELQTGRLRFIHYLAEAASLVGLVGSCLKPTPAAWQWVDAPEPQRWRTLWDRWHADLREHSASESLWARYRLPTPPPSALTVLRTFRSLAQRGSLSSQSVALQDLVPHIKAHAIGDGTLPPDGGPSTALQTLASGPLAWAGIIFLHQSGEVALTSLGAWLLRAAPDPPDPPPTKPAALRDTPDIIAVSLPPPPDRPAFRPLLTLGLPPTDRTKRCLSRDRFVDLLAHGLDGSQVTLALDQLAMGSLPPAVPRRLDTWAREAHGLTIRRLTVLSSTHTDLLEDLAARRTTSTMILETLSPHHIAVQPDEVDRLIRALRRRALTPLVHPGVTPNPPSRASPSLAGAEAYLWLALRITLNLGDLLALPAVPPASLLDQLEASLDPDDLAALAALAQHAREQLNDAIDGYTPYPAPLAGVDHAAVEQLVEDALREARPIKIVYHTAGRGERTERVVEPMRLDHRAGAAYLVAYCRLRQQERTFRLDRIERVVAFPAP